MPAAQATLTLAKDVDRFGSPRGGGQGAAPTSSPPSSGCSGDKDEHVITSGGMKGLCGFFTRDYRGAVVIVDLAGRLFTRVPTSSP